MAGLSRVEESLLCNVCVRVRVHVCLCMRVLGVCNVNDPTVPSASFTETREFPFGMHEKAAIFNEVVQYSTLSLLIWAGEGRAGGGANPPSLISQPIKTRLCHRHGDTEGVALAGMKGKRSQSCMHRASHCAEKYQFNSCVQ